MMTQSSANLARRSPRRSPVYAEPLLGGDGLLEPEQALQLFCHQLKVQFELSRKWQFADRTAKCIDAILRDGGLEARFLIQPQQAVAKLTIGLQDDWIQISIECPALTTSVFAERTYEDWELWPAGSSCDGDCPGTIGKRMHWAELEAQAWPELSGYSENGFIIFQASVT